jgi:hypothetical protein
VRLRLSNASPLFCLHFPFFQQKRFQHSAQLRRTKAPWPHRLVRHYAQAKEAGQHCQAREPVPAVLLLARSFTCCRTSSLPSPQSHRRIAWQRQRGEAVRTTVHLEQLH